MRCWHCGWTIRKFFGAFGDNMSPNKYYIFIYSFRYHSVCFVQFSCPSSQSLWSLAVLQFMTLATNERRMKLFYFYLRIKRQINHVLMLFLISLNFIVAESNLECKQLEIARIHIQASNVREKKGSRTPSQPLTMKPKPMPQPQPKPPKAIIGYSIFPQGNYHFRM